MGVAFLLGANFILVFLHYHDLHSIGNITVNGVVLVLIGFSAFCFYEGKIDSVIFDIKSGTLVLRRTDVLCKKNQTCQVSILNTMINKLLNIL